MLEKSTEWVLRLLDAEKKGLFRLNDKNRADFRHLLFERIPQGCLYIWKEKRWLRQS